MPPRLGTVWVLLVGSLFLILPTIAFGARSAATMGNTPPVAANDGFLVVEDNALAVAAPGVLGNDSDAEGDAMTAALVAAPAHGEVTLDASGGFTFTAEADFNGVDSFSYRASDGLAQSNVATVTLVVLPASKPPTANPDSYSLLEETPLAVPAPGVLGNDTDSEGNPLRADRVSGPTRGTLTLETDGSFLYTPFANFSGTDTFAYRAADSQGFSNVATVTLTVTATNDPPLVEDNFYSVAEDGALSVAAPGVLGNDRDLEGDPLTASVVAAPAHGALSFQADGSFLYTPDTNFSGTDSFSYQASDGLLVSEVATVTIGIPAVDDPPVAADDAFSMTEDQLLDVAAPGVLANDSDPDGGALVAALVAEPISGTFVLVADGGFEYVPDPNFSGTDNFAYRVINAGGQSNVATATIFVAPVNDRPRANADAYETLEGESLIVLAPGVLANDSDPDPGDLLSASVASGPANGTLNLAADGSFIYTPAAGFSGTDTFTYTLSDNAGSSTTGTVTITVTPAPLPVTHTVFLPLVHR